MIYRIINISKNRSLFLFGARGTGKSTLVKSIIHQSEESTLWIDLLKETDEERYGRHPDLLSHDLLGTKYDRVVIDEVQKAPKLLDIVHLEIEKNKNLQFILTGSSARKLKRGGANLLAGRAFTYSLFPFTFIELGDDFNLLDALKYGSLPGIYELDGLEKIEFLRSYVRTYLKEEIQIEQLIRKLNPFKDFLEIAAQLNGEILNYAKFSRDVGVDDKTIVNYFQILEDTLLGFYLPAFHRSVRKRQLESPKFYFFDLGVKRALERSLTIDLKPHSFAYGSAFEQFIIIESYRLNEYFRKDYRLSYLKTKDGAEIDLVILRPGLPDALIEIKSFERIKIDSIKHLKAFQKSWDQPCECFVFSQDVNDSIVEEVHFIHWKKGLKLLFSI